MSEGLAKSVEQTQPTQVEPAKDTQPLSHDTSIIHDEMYKFFNIASFDNFNKGHLETINNWALSDNNIGKGLRKIRSLEIKLGAPDIGESRISKLYNWIRLSDHINSVRSEMETELSSIGTKAKATVSDIRQTYKEKIEKLDADIASLRKAYKKVTQQYKLNATTSSKQIRNSYGKKLDELIEMRTAYKGRK